MKPEGRDGQTVGDAFERCATGTPAVEMSPTLTQRSPWARRPSRGRRRTTANVEVVQERGPDCRTTGSLVRLPAYTTAQYNNVQTLYLRAALEAGRFPEITTHFWVDRTFSGAHCDPRCFDLGNLSMMRASIG